MAVKFPLEINGVKVRTLTELKNNFDIEIVVTYFLNGKLKKWLEVWWYDEEVEKITMLNKEDTELGRKLCEIFGVEYTATQLNLKKILEKNTRVTKLKQCTSDEIVLENIDSVAFNQDELEKLYSRNVKKIYLCEGNFMIPTSKSSLEYILIGGATAEGLNIEKNNIKINFIAETQCSSSSFSEELADLIFNKSYVELTDYIVWTEFYSKSPEKSRGFYFYNKLMNSKGLNINDKFKVWDKKSKTYFTFNLPTALLSYRMHAMLAYENTLVFTDSSERLCYYDLKKKVFERSEQKLYLGRNCWTSDGKYPIFENTAFGVLDIANRNLKNIHTRVSSRTCYTYDNNKLYYLVYDGANSYVCVYDFFNGTNDVFYKFEEIISPFLMDMIVFEGELYIKFELDYKAYNKNYVESRFIGISSDGTAKRYFEKSHGSFCLLYDKRVSHKSRYLILEDSGNIHVFDMISKNMEKHYNLHTDSYYTFRVDDYLYIYNQELKECYRNDLSNGWNPIKIDLSIMF